MTSLDGSVPPTPSRRHRRPGQGKRGWLARSLARSLAGWRGASVGCGTWGGGYAPLGRPLPAATQNGNLVRPAICNTGPCTQSHAALPTLPPSPANDPAFTGLRFSMTSPVSRAPPPTGLLLGLRGWRSTTHLASLHTRKARCNPLLRPGQPECLPRHPSSSRDNPCPLRSRPLLSPRPDQGATSSTARSSRLSSAVPVVMEPCVNDIAPDANSQVVSVVGNEETTAVPDIGAIVRCHPCSDH